MKTHWTKIVLVTLVSLNAIMAPQANAESLECQIAEVTAIDKYKSLKNVEHVRKAAHDYHWVLSVVRKNLQKKMSAMEFELITSYARYGSEVDTSGELYRIYARKQASLFNENVPVQEVMKGIPYFTTCPNGYQAEKAIDVEDSRFHHELLKESGLFHCVKGGFSKYARLVTTGRIHVRKPIDGIEYYWGNTGKNMSVGLWVTKQNKPAFINFNMNLEDVLIPKTIKEIITERFGEEYTMSQKEYIQHIKKEHNCLEDEYDDSGIYASHRDANDFSKESVSKNLKYSRGSSASRQQ